MNVQYFRGGRVESGDNNTHNNANGKKWGHKLVQLRMRELLPTESHAKSQQEVAAKCMAKAIFVLASVPVYRIGYVIVALRIKCAIYEWP